MKKFFTLFLAIVFTFNFSAKADEGMWLLTLLNKNYSEMKAMGFKLSPEDIYSVNKGSLKDAIVQFGMNGRGFCTGEIISDKGLLLTNHHCGYGTIQQHSTVENDYLTDGFWAKTQEDEIPTPGQMVKFLKEIKDVTAEVTKELTDGMTEEERGKALREIGKTISAKAIEGKNDKVWEANVRSFFGGNHFYLLTYKIYNDVRFVGAPPQSVGKYGHDTDNWMWPRHTGDFSMFRVYMGADGEASEYKEDNVPLKPLHHLPVSTQGVKKDDFTMVLGYPGGTQRYMTSYEVDEVNSITHPNRVKVRGVRQEIMMADMQADPKVNIQYSAKFARSSNYWKFSIGQKKGLERLKIADQKRALEQEFTTWVNADDARKAKYGEALSLIEGAVKGRAEYSHVTQYLRECFLGSVEVAGMAGRAGALVKVLNDKKSSKKDKKAAIAKLQEQAASFYKNYNRPTDVKVAAAMVKIYSYNVDKKYRPDFYTCVEKKGSYKSYTDEMFNTSIFVSEEKLNKFLKKPKVETIENDMAYKMYNSAVALYRELSGKSRSFNSDFAKGHRLFVAGLLEMNPEKNYYPDANFTMRLTYGSVGDYQPADAVRYDYLTTMDGVMEKYVPGSYEFDLPKKLIDLYNAKDFGPYAIDPAKLQGDEKALHIAKYGDRKVMPVCFTSNNDITGGNSGSSVIDGNGYLVGLAFDGNWEAMSGDVAFETELQKCINVDARYLLFIIDKYAGAKRLIDEMDLK